MRTKFTIKSYFVILLTCAFAFFVVKITYIFLYDPYYDDKLFPKIFVPTLISFSFLYLLFGEIRTKNIIVELENKEIKVKRFFGLKIDFYRFSEIEGWKYSNLTSKGGTYEYLYLYNFNNKKIIKISEFYHSNYLEVKDFVKANFKSLGFDELSYIDEFKEIFT